MASNGFSLVLADIHHSLEEDNLSRQGETSAERITMHQLSSKAINSWRELLADSLSAAKTQTEAECGRAETRRGEKQETNLKSRPSG